MKLRSQLWSHLGVTALIVSFGTAAFAQVSEAQYELVTGAVKAALTTQSEKVATAISSVSIETRKSSLGGLAAFAALKRESVEAQRIRSVLSETEKARLLHRELPLAAIDIAITNSADRQSDAIAKRDDITMAKIATEIAQLSALQRGVPTIPNSRVVTRMPASPANVEIAPLPVVDRIYQPGTSANVTEVSAPTPVSTETTPPGPGTSQ